MSDIVERLKAEASDNKRYLVPDELAIEAAAEIEALRAEVERLRVALISARNFANSERRNTALLLSNPPQSSAAWNIRNHIDAALGEEKK